MSFWRGFMRRLMEIKEEQLWMERKNCCNIKEILEVLKGRKDGKDKD